MVMIFVENDGKDHKQTKKNIGLQTAKLNRKS